MKLIDRILALANQGLRVWERVKGDIPSRIGLGVLALSVPLIGGGGWAIDLSISSAQEHGTVIQLGFNFGCAGIIAILFGVIAFVCGLYMCLTRSKKLQAKEGSDSVALIFFHGFPKLNDEAPLYALPRNERNAIVKVEPTKSLDSYNPEEVVAAYDFSARTVQTRVYHGGVEKAYVAAIGSVPYLYIMGTTLRDGHLPFRLLEHNRSRNKWARLNDLGSSRSVLYNLNGITERSEISKILKEKSNEPVGVAVSFTLDIRIENIPENVKERTIFIELDAEKNFDVLGCEQVQEEVAKEVAHFLNDIGRDASELHVFLCAQASFILRLGMLYQDGMTGRIVVHNYDASAQSYPWALSFDGNKVVVIK